MGFLRQTRRRGRKPMMAQDGIAWHGMVARISKLALCCPILPECFLSVKLSAAGTLSVLYLVILCLPFLTLPSINETPRVAPGAIIQDNTKHAFLNISTLSTLILFLHLVVLLLFYAIMFLSNLRRQIQLYQVQHNNMINMIQYHSFAMLHKILPIT